MASKVQADQPSLSKTKLKDQLVAVFKGILRSDHSQIVASFISENLLPGAYQANVATAISEVLPRPTSAAPASKKVVLVQPLCWHCRRRGHKRDACPYIDKCKACLKYRNLKTGHFLYRPDNVCKKEHCLKHSQKLKQKGPKRISVDNNLQVNMIDSEIKYNYEHFCIEPFDSHSVMLRGFATCYYGITVDQFDYEYAIMKIGTINNTRKIPPLAENPWIPRYFDHPDTIFPEESSLRGMFLFMFLHRYEPDSHLAVDNIKNYYNFRKCLEKLVL